MGDNPQRGAGERPLGIDPDTGDPELVPLVSAPDRLPSREDVVRFLRTPLTRRSLSELAYVAISLPLAVVGFVYVIVVGIVGIGLAVTFVGLPLIAAGVGGARRLGAVQRRLASTFLGMRVAPPPPPQKLPGLYGWIQSGLADTAGWRAVTYLLLRFPIGAVTFPIALYCWIQGAILLSYPLVYQGDPVQTMHIGALVADNPTAVFVVALLGLALLLVAPWAVRAALVLDRMLIRTRLGPQKLSERVHELEESRAHAVEDSAAALRRIERDLHDGVQSRLVALAMSLGMIREKLDGGSQPVDVERARALVDNAHRNAKDAITEVRDLARGIHPPVLDRGLDAALATLAARSSIPVDLRVEIDERPSAAIETIAYFCVAELLTNVVKHARATRTVVRVKQREGTMILTVVDDGVGGARIGAGSGLPGLRERVRTVDGALRLASPPGGPTEVTIELPSHA